MKFRAFVFLLVLLLPLFGMFNYWHYLSKQNSLLHEQISFNSLENTSLNSLFELPNHILLHLTGIEKNNFKKLSFSITNIEDYDLNKLIEKELNNAQFSIVKVNKTHLDAEIWVLTGEKFHQTQQLALLYSNFYLLENPFNENTEIQLSNFINSLIKPELIAFNTTKFTSTITLKELTQILENQKPSTTSPPPDLFLEKIA